MEPGVVQRVSLRIVAGLADQGGVTLHAHRQRRSFRQRQREVAQAAEQVQHAVGGGQVQQVQRADDHATVHFSVNLDEIRRAECEFHAELRQRVAELDLGGLQAVNTRRPGWLQHHCEPGSLGECTQLRQVFTAKRLEVAKHQGAGPVAAGNFDLRYGLPRVHGQNQGGQRIQLPGNTRVQDMASVHISDKSAVTLSKSDQHPPLLAHVADGEAGFAPIPPVRTGHRRPELRRLDLADAGKILHKRILLVLDLPLRIEML